jgi:hypothetical protein
MALSRRERRALQAMYGPQKPWAYEKKRETRRKQTALMRDLVILCQKYDLDLDYLTESIKSVTGVDPDLF